MADRSNGSSLAGRRLILSGLDQAASSGSNFILVFLLARGTTPSEFGMLVLGYATVTVVLALQRGVFGSLLGMDLPSMPAEEGRLEIRRSLAGSVLLSAIASAALATAALVLLERGTTGWAFLALAGATPVALVMDLHRYWAVADARPHHALAGDAVWLGVTAASFVLGFWWAPAQSPTFGVLSWGLGGLLGLTTMIIVGQRAMPRWDGFFVWLRSDHRRRHLGTDAALQSAAPFGNSLGAALVAGPAITGAVRGAGTVFGPLNVLAATVSLAAVPEAKRAPASRAARLFQLIAIGNATAAVLWGTFLLLMPNRFGEIVLGETWAIAKPLLVFTMVEYVGLAWWAKANTIFRVYDATQTALKYRALHSAANLTIPVVAVAVIQSAVAFSASLAVVGVTVGTLSSIKAARIARRARGHDVYIRKN